MIDYVEKRTAVRVFEYIKELLALYCVSGMC